MDIETFQATDGYRFKFRRFPAQGARRGRVVYLHGIQSHGGWYVGSAAHLATQGFETLLLDRRGSGMNEEARGDCPSFRRLLLDIAEVVRTLDAPPFLVAVSWGGKLGMALERFHPGLTRGVALLAPGICPKVGPPFLSRLGIAFSRLFMPRKLFDVPLADPALFTANAARQAFIRDDPLALRRATARFLVESVRLDFALRRAPACVTVPLLLMLAGKDRVIDNERTKGYIARCAAADRTVIEYPEAHHTLEFEPDPSPAFGALAKWLEERAG
ncbi:MAG: lysophospholipase [Gemmataceae bacterium]|nr:lysophospholipase [Gemmataceae bacterium]